MRRLRFIGRVLIGASLTVAAGVAGNQFLNDGKVGWSWGYLALVFTVLGALAQAPQTVPPSAKAAGRRKGSQRDYLRRVRSSVDQMETIGLVTQAEFVLRTRQVYVDVTLQPKTVTDAVTDSGFGPTPPLPHVAVGRRMSLESFLTRDCVLAVLGAAGSGKTTLARYTALEMAERRWRSERHKWWRRRRVPVLLYLRDHAEAIQAEQPEGLPQIAVAAPWLDGVVRADWLERRLTGGQCVVLLDGLDEVADPQERNRVVRWVEAQISRYPGNSFVITSRPLGYDTNRLTRADVLQVQRFTNDQIRTFLHAWYRAIEHRARQADPYEIDRIAAQAADDLVQRISGRPTLYDLAANPLLLTMIANVHRYRGSLPGSRAALYEEVCHVLLHRRQEAKNLTDIGLDGLSGDKKERIIQELALYMMRYRLRDIPVEKAQHAIRAVLERTAPTLTPQELLIQARHSGLLLEQQYQRYGFAHLTLQEYLAAALIPEHPSRRQLLIDNVSDPWWRETTLLWAARADASPVVEACLAARTFTALNLAYACAAEARELDSALRGQLDQLLSTTPTDPEEVRLLDGVVAARALQDTHSLDDSTRICAHPVSQDLWNRYAARTGHAVVQPGPATGLWATDIKVFLTWLNNLFTDGTSYRLPTQAEARHALSSDLYPTPRTILYAADDDWASDHGQARLIPFSSAPHPHRPTPQRINAYPNLIFDHTHLLFHLLFPHSALTFSQFLVYAAPRDLDRPDHQLLHTIDLTIDLTIAIASASGRVSELARDHARELAQALNLHVVRDLVRALALDPDLALASASAIASASVLDLARDLALALDHDRALGRALDRALDLGRDLGRDLARALDLARDRDRDLVRVLALDGDLASALDLVRDLARDRARDRALDLGRDLARDLDPDLGRVDDLARALARDLGRARARDLDLALASARDRNPALDLASALDLGLARDLSFARAFASSDLGTLDIHAVVVLGQACLQLVHCFVTSESLESRRRRRKGEASSLSQFLHNELIAALTWSPADDPAAALKHTLHLARTHSRSDLVALIENALRLAAPLWDRNRPLRQSDMVLAATSVLAALTSSEKTTPELSQHLRSVLCTLIALTPDATPSNPEDPTPRDKLLVLIRN